MNPRRYSLAILTLTLAVSLSACSTSSPKRTGAVRGKKTESKDPAVRASPGTGTQKEALTREELELREVHRSFAQGQYETVVKKATSFMRRYPRSRLLFQAYNLQGLGYLLTQKPEDAIAAFKLSLDRAEKPEQRAAINYNLASAQFDAKLFEESDSTLNDINFEVLDASTKRKTYLLRGKIALQKEQALAATREFLKANELKPDTDTQDEIKKALRLIQEKSSLEALKNESIQGNNEPPLPGGDFILARLAEKEAEEGHPEISESYFQLLLKLYPESVLVTDVRTNLKAQAAESAALDLAVDGNTIGVLVPLKGKFAPFGESVLRAVSLAFRVFNSDTKDPGIRLVIEDSGEDGASAAKALETLVQERGASAVIGPLLSKGIDQVVQKADELKVPLISLAQKTNVKGESIFHSGLSAKLQAETIAKYAIEKLKLNSFAIVYPFGSFGEEYAQAFWTSVEKLGGRITAYESYQSNETDYRHVVDKVSGLYYTGARQRELDELARLRTQQKIKKRNRKTEQFFALKPIVDYDAVFIPDEPKNVGQLLPTFAYRDVDKMLFLGNATWHSDDLPRRLGPLADGTLFVDSFFLQSTDPAIRDFVKLYQETYEEDPGSFEALAYDASSLLKRVLLEETPKSRRELIDRLKLLKQVQGVTGKISYEDGFFNRPLRILTVKNGQLSEIAH